MSQFDSKIFNPDVFSSYMQNRIPRVRQNKLLTSGVLKSRPDLRTLLSSQAGGYYITVPMRGLIEGTPDNYDGSTDLTTSGSKTMSQSMVVVGRAHGWIENDFSAEVTGEDFMANVAAQIVNYWEDVDQDTLLSILKGIFLMGANAFTLNHTTDLTGEVNKNVTATTLNSATQKACGDNKNILEMIICDSTVATNLENISAITYLTYTDAQGIERQLGMGAWNGRLLLIDDSLPTTLVSSGSGTAGVYTLTVSGAGATGDKISFDGIEYTVVASGATGNQINAGNIAAMCTALETLLNAQYDGTFTVTKTTTTVVLTQDNNGYGAIPSVVVTPAETTGTLAANIVTTTAGAAATTVYNHTSYVLGKGAFDFCDCGVKQASEMDRDAAVNGGQDTLYSRQRKLFAPYGISFTKTSMATLSPTNAELELGANWELVNDGQGGTINHRAIPIVRIISRG